MKGEISNGILWGRKIDDNLKPLFNKAARVKIRAASLFLYLSRIILPAAFS